MSNANKHNLAYFESPSMRGLYDKMDEWQRMQGFVLLYSVFHSAAFAHIPDEDRNLSLAHDLSRSLAEAKILGSDSVRQLAEPSCPERARI